MLNENNDKREFVLDKECDDSINESYSKCDDCGKSCKDVTLEDFYGDGFLINLCNECAEYRSESL